MDNYSNEGAWNNRQKRTFDVSVCVCMYVLVILFFSNLDVDENKLWSSASSLKSLMLAAIVDK